MLRGIYTVSTVLEQTNRSMENLSNNLANINTTAYKKDISLYEEFRSELLYRIGGSKSYGKNKAKNLSIKEHNGFYNLDTNSGFFRVNGVNGVSYNTSIAFRRDEDGYLKTFYKNSNSSVIQGKGYKVLGRNGAIKIEDGQEFSVDKKGNLIVDGKVVDNLVFDKPEGVIGTMSGGIKLMRTSVDYEQGDFIQTHNPFDLSISGKGFFVINTPQGMRYTRDGSFKLSSDGTLVTNEGLEVQGINGKITGIKGRVGINEFGEISQDGVIIDKIQTVNPLRNEFLKKVGSNLYRYDAELTDEEKNSPVKILQGSLESSNVSPIEEMIKMMETFRTYESANKVVKSIDDTLGRAVNDIGKI